MAFDVSSIVSAVNSYLYSISDVNKLLTEGESAGKTSGLSDIFQKYLKKAVDDENGGKTSSGSDLDSLTDSEVMSALNELKGLTTSSAFDSSGSSSTNSSLSSFMTMSLPDLVDGKDTNKEVRTAQTARVDGSLAPVTAKSEDSMASAIASEIGSRFANADIEGQINQAFKGLDLQSEINSAFRNADAGAAIKEAFHGIDLKAEIENSINSHNKINEAVSYNESRLQAYKRSSGKATETSTFGDFRL